MKDLSGEAIHHIIDLEVDQGAIVDLSANEERIVILNEIEPFISVATWRGDWRASFGRRGGGPGEFELPTGLVLTGDNIMVVDPVSGTVSRFTLDGALLASEIVHKGLKPVARRYRTDGYGNPGRIEALRARVLIATYATRVGQAFNLQTLMVRAVDDSGGVHVTPVDFSGDSARFSRLTGGARELVDVPLWTVCLGADLVAYNPLTNLIVRYRGDNITQKDSVKISRVALDEETIKRNIRYQIEGLLAGTSEPPSYETLVESALEQSRQGNRFPDMGPVFINMMCDDHGVVWLQHFSMEDSPSGAGRTWTLLGSSDQEQKVRLPPGFHLWDIADSRLVGAMVDSNDVIQLGWISAP